MWVRSTVYIFTPGHLLGQTLERSEPWPNPSVSNMGVSTGEGSSVYVDLGGKAWVEDQ